MKIKDDSFNKNYEVDPNTGCWDWQASKTKDGYGQLFHHYYNIRLKEIRKCTAAHRYSWRIHFGPVPPELEVGHRCDNRGCVNPDHLWLATHKENIWDSINKGRWNESHTRGWFQDGVSRPNMWGRAFTPDEIRDIRRMGDAGYTIREIQVTYPGSKTAIANIRLRYTYQNVPEEG